MSGRILALDTASNTGSLAIVEDGIVTEQIVREVMGGGFSAVVFDEIRNLLERRDWALSTLDAFAAGAGPGSFTGVRVAVSAVKGLAEAVGRPAYAISNLAAAARVATGPLRAPWLDARRGEIYGALYRDDGTLMAPEMVLPQTDWLATLPGDAAVFAADGVPLAGALGEIAWQSWSLGDRPDPIRLDANYVRRSDAANWWSDR